MSKKVFLSFLVVAFCVSMLPSKAMAQEFGGRVGYSKTSSHSVTNRVGSPGYYHSTTNTRSKTRGAWAGGYVKGFSKQDLKSAYKNVIKPYARKNNIHQWGSGFNQPGFGNCSGGFSSYGPAPSFSPPVIKPPSFSAPSMPGF